MVRKMDMQITNAGALPVRMHGGLLRLREGAVAKHRAKPITRADGDMSDSFGRHRATGYFTYEHGVLVFRPTVNYEWQKLFEILPK